jgi:hypothetical protein
MQKRQIFVWGALLLLLFFLESMVFIKKPVITDQAKSELLKQYWKDPSQYNEKRWTDAENALNAKRTAATRLRYTILVLNGVCILLVGAMLAQSLGVTLPVKLPEI